MQCGTCAVPADRCCTRCGRPFCPRHGGMRKCTEGAGKGATIVTRALCDNCTPNQWWLTYGPFIGLGVIACIFAVFYFSAIQPSMNKSRKEREEFDRRWEENNRKIQQGRDAINKDDPFFPRHEFRPPAPVEPDK